MAGVQVTDKAIATGNLPTDAKMISDTIYSDNVSLKILGDAVMDWNDDPFMPSFKFTPLPEPLPADVAHHLHFRCKIHNGETLWTDSKNLLKSLGASLGYGA